MNSMHLVNATDIEQWAAQRLEARSQLLRLVRRLVLATTSSIEQLHFAADEGVQFEGWDGIVTVTQGSAFVPTGTSVWELGVDKAIKGKADSEYNKRSNNSLGIDTSTATFVFVTPRRWKKKSKEDWIRSRRAEGKWADIRAYDVDDLETWIEQAPGVHLWLSMLVGKHPQDALCLEDYWLDWSAKTKPQFIPKLVIGGREVVKQRIQEWLFGAPAVCALQGESSEEALAFLSSVIAVQEPLKREELFSRVVIAQSTASWRTLALSGRGSILIPYFDGEVDGITRTVERGNHVLLVGEHRGVRTPDSLPRISRPAAEEALLGMGLPRDRAYNLATLARRSLPALRRKLASEPKLRQPEWAQLPYARDLLAPLLVSSWQDNNLLDREILTKISGLRYEQLHEKLVYWSKAPDPPVRLVGGTWMMAAPEDSWRLLAPYITDNDIHTFRNLAIDVLRVPNKKTVLVRST